MSDGRERGERVVLGQRNESSMNPFQWSGKEPEGLSDVEWAEELGDKWEDDELVTYVYPAFEQLPEHYEKGEYLPDND